MINFIGGGSRRSAAQVARDAERALLIPPGVRASYVSLETAADPYEQVMDSDSPPLKRKDMYELLGVLMGKMQEQIMGLMAALHNVDEDMREVFPGVKYIDVEIILLVGFYELKYVGSWTEEVYEAVKARFGGHDRSQHRLQCFVAALKDMHRLAGRGEEKDFHPVAMSMVRFWNDMFLAMRREARVLLHNALKNSITDAAVHFELNAPSSAPHFSWSTSSGVAGIQDDSNRLEEVEQLILSRDPVPSATAWAATLPHREV